MPTPATDRYDYRSAGFNQFMKRRVSGSDVSEVETGDESSFRIRHLSGTSISSGLSKSSDGKLKIDWNNAQFVATDGARNRVEIGKIEGTEEYGIRIYNAVGDLVFSAAGELQSDGLADGSVTSVKITSLSADKITTGTLSATTVISVGDDNIRIDGENKRIIINDGTNDRVLIGYQLGGF